jgi:hypothetical protein
MSHAMKQVTVKEENPYIISWQQFRENYAGLDTLTGKGVPEVSLFHLALFEYLLLFILANSSIATCRW